MAYRMFRIAALLSVLSLSTALLPPKAAQAQYTNLTENQSYIRNCRQIKQGVRAIVYDNTDLANKPTNQIGTLFAGTQVTLTGVLRETGAFTAVQVYLDDGNLTSTQPVGWVNAAQLTTCTRPPAGNPPPPVSSDTPYGQNTCFRPRTTLVVRTGPSINAGLAGMAFTTQSSITPTTIPPTYATSSDRRVWLQVSTYRGPFWVASSGENGQGTNLTPVRCR